MMNKEHKQKDNRMWKTFGLMGALLVGALVQTQAGALKIHVTGLDLNYAGNRIFDAGSANTVRNGDPSQADSLTTMDFYENGIWVGRLNQDIYADVYLDGVGGISSSGGTVTSSGNSGSFGFDLFTNGTQPGWGLGLDADTVNVAYFSGGLDIVAGGGVASGLHTQDLPFGLQYDGSKPIAFSFSSTDLAGVTSSAGVLTGFNASGTGNVTGVKGDVPEPSEYLIGGLGLLILLMGYRYRMAGKHAPAGI
jgi:hypothetical protein